MKKKIMAAMLAASMMVTLTACGESEVSNDYITISQYKDLEVEKVDKTEVSDSDVESTIQSTLEENATTEEIKDRAAKEGDTVNIDFDGQVDGKALEGGSSTGYDLKLGSNSFIDGFEQGIVGHKIGDKFKLNLKFPDDYQSTDIAGKKVVFTVKLNSISVVTTPELTDELVTKISKKSKTVKEYKNEVKKTLEDSNEDTYNSTLLDNAWKAVLEKTKVKKYPKGSVSSASDEIKQQYEQMATAYGMQWADFLSQYLNMTEESFQESLKTAAQTSVKEEQVTELLCEKLKLTPSKEEYEKAYKKLAKQYNFDDVNALKQAAPEKDLKKIVRQDKVKEYLADHCIQVEKETSSSTTNSNGSTSTESTTDNSTSDSSN